MKHRTDTCPEAWLELLGDAREFVAVCVLSCLVLIATWRHNRLAPETPTENPSPPQSNAVVVTSQPSEQRVPPAETDPILHRVANPAQPAPHRYQSVEHHVAPANSHSELNLEPIRSLGERSRIVSDEQAIRQTRGQLAETLNPKFRNPPTNTIRSKALLGDGMHCFWGGDFDVAIARFSAANQFDPTNAACLYFLALAYKCRGDAECAEEMLAAAVRLESDYRVHNWGVMMTRVQGSQRLWLEEARRISGVP